MTHAEFETYTFNQALARARAREALEIAQAAAGNVPKPSRDIGDMLREQAESRLRKILGRA